MVKCDESGGFSTHGSSILTDSNFDARNVAFAELGDPRLSGKLVFLRSSEQDVDGDGDIDLMLHFRVPDLVAHGAIDASSTALRLTGTTIDGRQIEGRDSVRIVPPR